MKDKKKRRRLKCTLLALVFCIVAIQMSVMAEEVGWIELIVKPGHTNGLTISDATVELYQVGTVDHKDGYMELLGDPSIIIKEENRKELFDKVNQGIKSMTPVRTGKTNTQGSVTFEGLPNAVYYGVVSNVTVGTTTTGVTTYETQSFLIRLPKYIDGNISEAPVTIYPKANSTYKPPENNEGPPPTDPPTVNPPTEDPGDDIPEELIPGGPTDPELVDPEVEIPEDPVPAGPIPQTGLQVGIVMLLVMLGLGFFTIGWIDLKRKPREK